MEIPSKDICVQVYFPQKNIYSSSIIIEVNLEVLRSRHLKTTEFRSRCCFCVRHEKCTDKLLVRQQSNLLRQKRKKRTLGETLTLV